MSLTSGELPQAISVIQGKEKKDSKIIGIVYQKINNNEYKVSYQNSLYTVYNDNNIDCKIGESVYILLPDGDINNRKTIINTVANEEDNEKYKIGKVYYPVDSENLLKNNINITKKKDEAPELEINLSQYMPQNNLFELKGNFLFNTKNNNSNSNYEIITILFNNGETSVIYNYDILGTINQLHTNDNKSIPQTFFITAPQGATKISKIYLNQDLAEGEQISFTSLKAISRYVINKNAYELIVHSNKGTTIKKGSIINSGVTLTADLWHGGKKVDLTGKTILWYKNVGGKWVEIENSNKDKSKCIINDIDSSRIKSYRYKAQVLLFDKQMCIEDTIQIDITDGIYNIKLKMSNNLYELVLCEGSAESKQIGDWYYNYKGENEKLISEKPSNKQDITSYINNFDGTLNFTCVIKDNETNKILYEINYSYINNISKLFPQVNFVASQDIFHYNADNKIPPLESEQVYQISATIPPGIEGYSISSWLVNGERVTTSPLNPINSLLNSVTYDPSKSIVTFKVANQYKYNTNNTFSVVIKDNNNQEFIIDKEIIFIKDGQMGTNGTENVVVIKVVEEGNGIPPYNYLGNSHPLKLQLNKKENTTTNFQDWTYELSPNLSTIATATVNGNTLTITANDNFALKESCYVKIIATTAEGKKIVSYYPVNLFNGDEGTKIKDFYLYDAPSYIQYNSDKTNPILDKAFIPLNNTKAVISNNIKEEIPIKYEAKGSLFIFTEKDANGVISLQPNKILTEDFVVGAIKVFYSSESNESGYYHTVIGYSNKYANAFINQWEDNKVVIGSGSIVAPQIAAGRKNTENQFTGIAMGSYIKGTEANDSSADGLFGFKDGNVTFKLDPNNGSMTLGGNINMTGKITWNTTSNPVKVVYHPGEASGTLVKPADGTTVFPADYDKTEVNGWHTNFNPTSDFFASYSYNGGATWGNPVKTVGDPGENGKNGKDAYGIIKATEINDSSVVTPEMYGNYIGALGCFETFTRDEENGEWMSTGYIGSAKGREIIGDNTVDTAGIAMIASSGIQGNMSSSNPIAKFDTAEPYLITTTEGVRMSAGGNHSLYVTKNQIGVQDGKEIHCSLSEYIKKIVGEMAIPVKFV